MRYVLWLSIILGVHTSTVASENGEQLAPYPTSRPQSPMSYQLGDTFHALVHDDKGHRRPAILKRSSEHAINGDAKSQTDEDSSDETADRKAEQVWVEIPEQRSKRYRCNCDCYCSEDTKVNIVIVAAGILAFGVIGGGIVYLLF